MSKIIPPMVSSSPPPMDDNLDEDDDDDDEFGSFSTANFSYNLDTITQPSKLSTNGEWEGNVKHQYEYDTIHLVEGKKDSEVYNDVAHHNGTHSSVVVLLTEEDEVVEAFPQKRTAVSSNLEMQQDNTTTSHDSVASLATDSGLCSASQDSEGTSLQLTTKAFIVSVPSPNNIGQDESSSSHETLVTSSDVDLLGQLPSSSEKPDGVGSKRLSEQTYLINDLNSIEKRLQDSNPLSTENSRDQSPKSSIINKFMDTPVDDYCDFSNCQDVRNNILTSEPTTSVLCISSDMNDSKTNADETIDDQLSNTDSSDSQGKLFMNNNLINVVSLGCEIISPDNSRRHLSSKLHLETGLESFDMGECDDAPITIENIVTSSEVLFSSESHASDDDFADFSSSKAMSLPVTSSVPVSKPSDLCGSDDEFADFAFSEAPSLPVPLSAPVIKPNESLESDDEFADFTFSEAPSLPVAWSAPVNKPNETFVSNDEFADFACSVVPPFPPVDVPREQCWADESALQLPIMSSDLNPVDDDFDDFETASFSSAATTGVDNSQLTSRLENVVTALFPGPAGMQLETSEASLLPSRPMIDDNPVWGDLRDVDTSHALSYQWVSSSANKMLLSALGIDTRNILFGSKWNVAVPRFAANLGISPLQPVRARSPPTLQPIREPIPKSSILRPESSSTAGPEATVPAAQFDWNSSGLVNPLDCMEKDGHRSATSSHRKINHGQQFLTSTGGRQGISSEAVKVLESLPNLSFLRTKTLIFPPPGQALTH